jgi:hypothetical protein
MRIKNTFIGLVLGAAFGVIFASLASLTHVGPTWAAGVQETWWWFAGLGAFAGFWYQGATEMAAK